MIEEHKTKIHYGQVEWLFFLYFAVMLAHSPVPYLKFILFILCILLAVYRFTKCGINRVAQKNVRMCLLWYGVFFVWVYCSRYWSYVQRLESDIISTMVRILCISLCIACYATNRKKILTLFDIMLKACTYFAIIYLITSPINTWGTVEMGGITDQWRNFTGHFCAMCSVIAYVLQQYFKKRLYYIYMIICIITTVLTGSRGSILAMGVMFVLLVLLQENISKRIRNCFIGIFLFLIVAFILFSNEYLYNIYGTRLLALFNPEVQDLSMDDRAMYIEFGFYMFLNKPILGWGMDNFAYYLKYFGGYVKEVYSHCNYIEILSCYGLIGFIIYYTRYIKATFDAWKIHKTLKADPLIKLVLIILARFLIFEYSTITFSVYLYIYMIVVVFCTIHVIKYEQSYALKDGGVADNEATDNE